MTTEARQVRQKMADENNNEKTDEHWERTDERWEYEPYIDAVIGNVGG